jgi:hypothetical protein
MSHLMRCMGRVLGLTVAAVALIAVIATPAAAATVQAHCTNCGYISAHGKGTITEKSTSGIGYATVKTGTISTHGGTVRVYGSSHHYRNKSGNTVYSGSGMSVSASGSFWLQITGTTSNFGSTAHASVTLKGTGVYTLNSSSQKKPWSAYPRTLAIRW